MSTRAQIAFYPSENTPVDAQGTVYLYQHQDGSPEYLLPVLESFVRAFRKRRSLKDTEYATARCLVALAQAQASEADEPNYLGLGAGTVLYPTRISVYAVSDDDGPSPAFHLQHTVPLTPPASPQREAVPEEVSAEAR